MKKLQEGQALVLVLLSLAVVLTLVLYILSRSVTDVLVSSRNEETARAFSAAEAGVEQALILGSNGSGTLANSSGYSSTVTNAAEGSNDFNYPIELSSGDDFTLWFTAHDASGNPTCSDPVKPCFTGNTIKVCWGRAGTSSSVGTTPAIEASVFYETTPGTISTAAIGRAAIDPNSGRTAQNFFAGPDAGTCTISGVNYQFNKVINFSDLAVPAGSYTVAGGLQFLRIRMLYNSDVSHPIGVTTSFAGSTTLPSQGSDIISTGYTCPDPTQCGTLTNQSTRRISVFQGWPEPPSVFDFAIYNATGLVK